MGHLKNRIQNRSDSYYVEKEAYRDARRRHENNKFMSKFIVGTMVLGLMLGAYGFASNARNFVIIGIVILLINIIISYIYKKERDSE